MVCAKVFSVLLPLGKFSFDAYFTCILLSWHAFVSKLYLSFLIDLVFGRFRFGDLAAFLVLYRKWCEAQLRLGV